MNHVRAGILYGALLSALATPPIHAAASYPAVPLPALESDPAGTVTPQTCTVNLIAGMVKLDLSTQTAYDVPALLLNGPFFGWLGPSEPYPDRQFPELKIAVDGRPIVPQDRFEAFAGTYNVTNLIKAAAMDPWAITRTPPLAMAPPQYAQTLHVLKNVRAIEASGDAYLAKWTVRRVIRIPLAVIPQQQVELDYMARPAVGRVTADQLDTRSREKLYCISPQDIQRIARRGASPPWLAIREYSIPTGIDGNAPTAVTLTMSTTAQGSENPPIYLFSCAPRGKAIARKSSMTHELVDVDEAGILHVLSVAQEPESQQAP
jgi:hypothetical protein